MANELVKSCEDEMTKKVKAFEGELTKVRTGRASISILDRVRVEYYGTPTPLNQVANLSTPDAKTIAIAPFEKSLISEIEKSILKADLGLTPTSDGNLVRIPVPQLSEERRKDIAKNLKKIAEDAKVGLRMVRRDINEEIKKREKSKTVNEDESKRLQQDIQKSTDKFIKMIDDKAAAKEKEVMTI
jgi:ribosome recycling factor